MGGIFQPGTTIHGNVGSPGIPIIDSPTGGFYETQFGGIGSSLVGEGFSELNLTNYFLGFKPIAPFTIALVGGLTGGTTSPWGGVASPDSAHIFVANYNTGTVAVFARDTITGLLTAVAGSPFAVGTNPREIIVTPDGQHVLVTNYNSANISVFSLNPVTGFLTPVVGSPFASGGANPWGITVSSNGSHIFVANNGGNNLSVFTINSTTGLLTPIAGSPFALGAGTNPTDVVISPDDSHIYVCNLFNSTISAFNRNLITGALSAVVGSPFADGVGTNPIKLVVSRDNKFLYAVNNTTATIAAFSISASGVLASILGSPFAIPGAPSAPEGIIITPDNLHLAVVNNGDGAISVYTRNIVTGSLTLLAGSPFATGSPGAHDLIQTPDGQNFYVTDFSANAYQILQTTTLLTYHLVDAFFDPTGGLNGIFRINGQLSILGSVVATQNFVIAAIATAVVGLLDDRGNYDASGNTYPATGGSGTAGAILKGDLWFISVVGTLNGVLLSIGDTVRALVDTPGQTNGNWDILQVAGAGGGGSPFAGDIIVDNTTAAMTVGSGGASEITNTAMGVSALQNNTAGAVGNTAIGYLTLFANTSGGSNTAVGAGSLQANTGGTNNIALGLNALAANNNGGSNLAIGNNSLANNLVGVQNIAIGEDALNLTTVNGLVAVGFHALAANTIGINNTAIGTGALQSNIAGSYNTALGFNALISNTSGAVFSFGAIVPGSLYAPDATYPAVPLISITGIGTGASADITVFGGVVTAVVLVDLGSGYLPGDSLSANDSDLGNSGFGSGFTIAVATIQTGNINTAIGNNALSSNISGIANTAVGVVALSSNVSGTNNVALGASAGSNEIGSYTLYIDGSNTGTLTPLIYGLFDPAGGVEGFVKINGGLHLEIKTVAAAYPVTDFDYTLRADATVASFTITLQVAPLHGDIKNIKKIDATANTITIDGNGNLIDGAATIAISTQYSSVTLQYDLSSTTWNVL